MNIRYGTISIWEMFDDENIITWLLYLREMLILRNLAIWNVFLNVVVAIVW